jgi:acyl carrier protein
MFRKIQNVISKAKKAGTREDEAAVNVDGSVTVEIRIKAIMAKVFKMDINEINEETSADNIDQWTSLEHVDFLVKLQQEFEIEFTDSQIVEMLSYKTVVQHVRAAMTDKSTDSLRSQLE